MYHALDPIKLLDYPAEDVFDLINGTIDYNSRNKQDGKASGKNGVIRKKAGDDWF